MAVNKMDLIALRSDFEEIARFVTSEPDKLNGYMLRVFSLTNIEILNALIKGRESYNRIILSLNSDPWFVSAYGEEASRFLLGFLREFIDIFFCGEGNGDFEAVFEAVWERFEKDITGDDYLYTELAPVFLTEGNEPKLELPGPVFLYKWGNEELKGLLPPKINVDIVEDLLRAGPYGPGYVLVAREKVKKTPKNFLSINLPRFVLSQRISAAVDVMRLYAKGDIYLGPVYGFREPQHEYITVLGTYSIQRQNQIIPFGEKYNVDAIDLVAIRKIYDSFETLKSFKNWSNIFLALRRFVASYSRLHRKEDVLIDLVIVLEALLVSGPEQVGHKLASNAAALLVQEGEDKLILYKKLKKYYDIRSKLVHGGEIKQKEREYLKGLPELKEMTRRLLVGFMGTAVEEGDSAYKSIHAGLDCLVINERLLSRIKKNFN
jgi:hypothetical protein